MSGTSERANARASGLVLTFRFLFVSDHSGAVAVVGGSVMEPPHPRQRVGSEVSPPKATTSAVVVVVMAAVEGLWDETV